METFLLGLGNNPMIITEINIASNVHERKRMKVNNMSKKPVHIATKCFSDADSFFIEIN